MTTTDAERMHFAGPSQLLHEGFAKITAQLARDADLARHLSDHTLLAFAAWTQGTDAAVTAECARRYAEHDEQRAKFAAFGGDQRS